MVEEIASENKGISNFQGFMTLTLTLDRVILHTVVHHSSTSTSTYTPNFIDIEESFCGWTDGRTNRNANRNSYVLYRLVLFPVTLSDPKSDYPKPPHFGIFVLPFISS